MPKRTAKKRVSKKIEPKAATSLADEILNGAPQVEEVKETDSAYHDYKMTPVMEDSPVESEVVEPAPEVAEKSEPDVAEIPVVKAKSFDENGVRFYDKSLAGRTAQGSVGHDLIFKVAFDDKGLSEFVTDEKVIDKLLKCGYKVFKA